MGIDDFKMQVEAVFATLIPVYQGADQRLLDVIKQSFVPPDLINVDDAPYFLALEQDAGFKAWVEHNVQPHKAENYACVTVSLKRHGETPGDATSGQMRALADVAEQWAHGELRVSHEQNIVLPYVPIGYLHTVYAALSKVGLETANVGLISDLIACPGMDYCTLATARSIPIAQAIANRFNALGLEAVIGDIKVKISGCINACGHHHVGHIGILGMDRGGEESYQITLGGDAGPHAKLGQKTGRGFSAEEIVPAIERIITAYLSARLTDSERFSETFERVGSAIFLKALYETDAMESDHAA
jgi:sulfite reductase (NADPH) hemoprotein beta-component